MKKTETILTGIDKVVSVSRYTVKISLIIVLVCIIGTLITVKYMYDTSASNIYVLDKEGDIGSAVKQDVKNRLEAEADNHLRMFYSTFFSYDVVSVEENVEKGLNLGGESVKELWRTYKVNDWYNKVIQNNLIVKSEIDSSFFDFDSKPYRALVYGHQLITNGYVTEKRTLNLKCNIREVSREKMKNPHGLLIDNVIITNNETMKKIIE